MKNYDMRNFSILQLINESEIVQSRKQQQQPIQVSVLAPVPVPVPEVVPVPVQKLETVSEPELI